MVLGSVLAGAASALGKGSRAHAPSPDTRAPAGLGSFQLQLAFSGTRSPDAVLDPPDATAEGAFQTNISQHPQPLAVTQ